ncbi:hypothetical protein RHS01_07075 [Rhizoctonia solani]|uniref:Uncharacterized protein n=1 Tax=Rhizoctonia solani TaxID=456999 RepID=A0A8H7I8U1_9AGAM|nr:hypothetical protein RHS01_07075 [Rhizoctonia solani]
MPAAPTLPLQPVVPGHASTHSDFDYEEIASFMSERLVEDLAGPVADRVADRVAAAITDRLTANSGAGPVRATRERKRRERCRLVQTRITYLLKKGLHVSKLEDIGSDRQPNELDLDHDNEAPWSIDWTVGPDHLSNRNVVDNWVGEVLRDKEMIRLHRKGRIMDDQFTDNFVRSLLPHTWDTVRKSVSKIAVHHPLRHRKYRGVTVAVAQATTWSWPELDGLSWSCGEPYRVGGRSENEVFSAPGNGASLRHVRLRPSSPGRGDPFSSGAGLPGGSGRGFSSRFAGTFAGTTVPG